MKFSFIVWIILIFFFVFCFIFTTSKRRLLPIDYNLIKFFFFWLLLLTFYWCIDDLSLSNMMRRERWRKFQSINSKTIEKIPGTWREIIIIIIHFNINCFRFCFFVFFFSFFVSTISIIGISFLFSHLFAMRNTCEKRNCK